MITKLINNRYEQYQLIGSGGLAQIYEGWDVVEHRAIAIKKLSPDATRAYYEEGLGKFEAPTLNLARHPNIIELYDSGEDEEGLFHILELVEGQNLEQILQRAPLIESDFLTVAHQCLEGLAAIHRQNIFHCDIKPENIMITRDEFGAIKVKILDFGLAKFFHENQSLAELGKQEILATPEYVSPELLRGEKITIASDLYSMGQVFYHCLAGEPAFSFDNIDEIVKAHLNDIPRPLLEIRPDIDPVIARCIHKLLNKVPKDRYPSADAILALFTNLERKR